MATSWYVRSSSASIWTANTVYTTGQRVVATSGKTATQKFRVFECTTPGTSHLTTEPNWGTVVGNTQADNTVTWTIRNPTTWLNANPYLFRVLHLPLTAGDTIYVSQAHAESQSGNSTNFSVTLGTRDTPTYVLCANDGAEPPTALATGAVVAYAGGISLSSYVNYYGIDFQSGVGASITASILLGSSGVDPGRQVYEHCTFTLASTGGSSRLSIGESTGGGSGFVSSEELLDCDFVFGASGAAIAVNAGQITITGGVVSGTAPTTLFFPATQSANRVLIVTGLDMSPVSGTVFSTGTASTTLDGSTILFQDCRVHASATIFGGTPTGASGILRAVNCAATGINYKEQSANYYGTLTEDIATYLTGGASDGTTPASRQMITTANAKRVNPLYSPWMVKPNSVIGSVTITVEIFRDSVTDLKDNEVWLEVLYLGSASYPIATLITDASDVLAAGANQTTSAASWTNSATNPNEQKLSVTFTTALEGAIYGRVALGKASTTLWYNHALDQT